MWDKGLRFQLQRLFLGAIALCCMVPAGYLLYSSARFDGRFSLWQFEQILLGTKAYFT